MITRYLAVFFLSSSILLAEPVKGKGHLLASQSWGPPAGMVLQLNSTSSLLHGEVKMVNNGSWSTGTTRYLGGQSLVARWIDDKILEVNFNERRGTYRRFINGQRTNEIQPAPLEESVVHMKQFEGEWSAEVVQRKEKEEVEDEEDQEDEGTEEIEAARLERELGQIEAAMENDYSQNLFGKQARKVGETWTVKNPRLPWFNDERVLKGEATVTFEKVKKVNGDPAAFLSFSVIVRTERPGDQKMVVDFEGKGQVVRSLKYLADYEMSGAGAIDMTVETGESSYVETVGKYQLSRKIELFPIEDKK